MTTQNTATVYIHTFSVRKKGTKRGDNRTNFVLIDTDKSGKLSAEVVRKRLLDDGDYDLRSLSYNCAHINGGIAMHEPVDAISPYGIETVGDDVTV